MFEERIINDYLYDTLNMLELDNTKYSELAEDDYLMDLDGADDYYEEKEINSID